jgi:cytochrome c oxidase subunit II
MTKLLAWIGLVVAVFAAPALARQPAGSGPASVQVIEMTAQKYHYSPSTLRVKEGAKVVLRITALDHDHGFKISRYPEGDKQKAVPGLLFSSSQDKWLIKKAHTETVEFVATRPGTYEFRCSHFCGFGHSRMKGQLVVEP